MSARLGPHHRDPEQRPRRLPQVCSSLSLAVRPCTCPAHAGVKPGGVTRRGSRTVFSIGRLAGEVSNTVSRTERNGHKKRGLRRPGDRRSRRVEVAGHGLFARLSGTSTETAWVPGGSSPAGCRCAGAGSSSPTRCPSRPLRSPCRGRSRSRGTGRPSGRRRPSGLLRLPLRLLLRRVRRQRLRVQLLGSPRIASTSSLPSVRGFRAFPYGSCTLSLCPKIWASEKATLRPPVFRRGSGRRGPSPGPRPFVRWAHTFPFRCCSFPFAFSPSRFGTEEALAAKGMEIGRTM